MSNNIDKHWLDWIDYHEFRRMPLSAVIEMIAAWKEVHKTADGVREWYKQNKHTIFLHAETSRDIERLLGLEE